MLSTDRTQLRETARQAVLQEWGLPHSEPDGTESSSTPGEKLSYEVPPGLEDLVKLAVQVSGMDAGVINIITADQQHQIAAFGVEASVCSREDSMCSQVFTTSTLTAIVDATDDPRFADNPFVTGELGQVRSYASVPLETTGGNALGSLCVFSPRVLGFDVDQREGLQILARQVVDVLDLQHTTRQLTQALETVRSSNENLARFAGRVSHDLKTPLASILEAIELSKQDDEIVISEQVGQYLDIIGGSATRMLSAVEEVLEFSRIGGAITRRTVCLDAVMGAVLQDIVSLSRTSDPVITVHGAQLFVDQAQVTALLQNLVCNALKYSLPGARPLIEIEANVDERQVLRVIDHGKGIAPQDRQRALEPLVRLRRPGDPPGTGIGLATCARIAAAHDGSIDLTETPGGGTTVIVDLGPTPNQAHNQH